jgi:hypothetical protein
MSGNVALLMIMMTSGIVIGCLLGAAWSWAHWYKLERTLRRANRVLSEHIHQMTKKPLKLDSPDDARSQMLDSARAIPTRVLNQE